jgi:formylglycine-generating enzyme required for sulfatase activity/energy-coupling factor transporter ATP-binding protein EcfA2
MKTRRVLFILSLIILLLTAGLVLYDQFVKTTLPGSWAAILGIIGAALLLTAGFLDNLSGAFDFITRLLGGGQEKPELSPRKVKVEDQATYQEFNAPVTFYPMPSEAKPAGEDDSFDASLRRYLQWVQTHYGRLNLRGVEERQRKIHDLTLDDVYVSLAATLDPDEAQRRQPEQEKPDAGVDMRDLLSKNDKLAITGAPGCGKTTYLRIIAGALARAHLTEDVLPVQRRLGLDGPLPIPIFITLSEYNRYRRQRRDAVDPEDGTLRRFITHRLRGTIGRLPADFFERLLSGGHPCMLLLDGLDEVADETERRLVSAEVQNLVDSGDAAQIIVTSRTRAYRGQSRLADFRVALVLPMTGEQVAQLVKQWCSAVYEDELVRQREQMALQSAIDGLEAKRRARNELPLIDTPLMVTVVAIVHYNEKRLPEQRAALYKKCVEVLLADKHHSATDSTEALRQWGGTETAKFQFLAFLAYKMMCTGEQAGRSVAERQMKRWLLPEFKLEYGLEVAKVRLQEFIEAMRSRESLVSEENAQYWFVHLTFQEFLAAYFLAETVREQQGILDFWAADERLTDSWWREAVLLTIGHMGGSSKKSALQLVQKLGGLTGSDELQLAAAELAAVALLELESQDEGTQQQISGRLARLLAKRGLRLQPATRALAGDALGRLGDERPSVCSLEPELLPITDELTFLMGAKKQPVTVPQPFAIARYPVTNTQFRYFYEDGGYTEKWQRCWTPKGWEYRDDGKWTQPRLWNHPQFNLPNQPVVAISWYEAVAYANWLAEKTGQPYRLPTEAEWERAARHTDGRIYPWGSTWQQGYANSKETGIGRPTAVGIFPDGTAECGALDLSGNVSEWCQTRWHDENRKDYPPIWQDSGRENLAGDRRVLKGGAYYSDKDGVPAAARDWYPSDLRNYDMGLRVVVSPFISGL